MCKVAFSLSVVLCSWTFVCAQPKEIDSLERILARTPAGHEQVDILNALSRKYLPYKPKISRQYAEQAIEAAQKQHYLQGEIAALNCLSEYEYRQGNYARSVEVSMETLKMAEQIHDSVGMAMANRVLGLTYAFGFKQYDLALKYQLNAVSFYEKKKDKAKTAAFYGNLSWIYAGLKQNLPEAHRLAKRGIEIADSLGDKQLMSYNYNSQGLIFFQEGALDSTLVNLTKSNELAEEASDRAVIAYNKIIIGKVYLQQHKYTEAITVFEAALKESSSLHLLEVLKDSYDGLRQGYEGLNNFELAYRNHFNYLHLRDSLVNWETTQRALITRLEFEGQSKIAELESANQQERNEQIIYEVLFGLILIFLIMVVLLAARNNSQRKETNRLLQEKNQEIADQNLKLKEANDVKDKFFSILSHDLRSPLTSLKGLLSLLASNEINDEEFRSFAPKINQRLMGVSETLENLLHWSQSQIRGMGYNPTIIPLKAVIDKCLSLFLEAAAEKKLTFSNEISKDISVYADKNQIELVFRNLIHNAIKFTPTGGAISLTITPSEPYLEVCISDTGVGMTQEQVDNLFRNVTARTTHGTDGEKGTGLGLLLCKEMMENNGGKLSVTSTIGKGSTLHVYLKKHS
ncbi:hypothetical protein BH09BAC3_BH09BAC3_08790 [soil metagenome]